MGTASLKCLPSTKFQEDATAICKMCIALPEAILAVKSATCSTSIQTMPLNSLRKMSNYKTLEFSVSKIQAAGMVCFYYPNIGYLDPLGHVQRNGMVEICAGRHGNKSVGAMLKLVK